MNLDEIFPKQESQILTVDMFKSLLEAKGKTSGKFILAEVKPDIYESPTGPRHRLVLTFSNFDKKWSIGPEVAYELGDLLGSNDPKNWVGCTVELKIKKVKGPQGFVDGIRPTDFKVIPEKKALAADDMPF